MYSTGLSIVANGGSFGDVFGDMGSLTNGGDLEGDDDDDDDDD